MSDPKITIEMKQGEDLAGPDSSPVQQTGQARKSRGDDIVIEEVPRNEEQEGLLLDRGLKEIHDQEVKKKILVVIGIVVGLIVLILGAAFVVYFVKFHSDSSSSSPTPTTPTPTSAPTTPTPTTAPPNPNADPTTLLLISLDGFRHDYFNKPGAKVDNLKKLISGGCKAEYLKPVFPSKTFPNHYAIVTGLHPPFHGIVSNTFYDPVFNQTFTLGNGGPSDGKWWNGEPMWVTVQTQNKTAATMFWPGSEAAIKGVRPQYWAHYDKNFSFDKRVKQLFEWLDSTPRPTFLTLYLEGVDSAGHLFGPDSPQVLEAINHVDETIGLVLDEIEKRQLKNMNIMVVSDHGMTNLNNNTVIFLDDYIDLKQIKVVEFSPILSIIPTKLTQDEVFEKLSNKHPNMTIYKKEEMLERFIYNQSRRITPIIGVADEGWTISQRSHPLVPGGNHGYDNVVANMWGIFIANGKLFKKNYSFPHFQNVNIYNLMCKILGLNPAPNNGTNVLFDLLEIPSP